MANVEVGSAFVSIYPKTDKLQSGIASALGGISFGTLGGNAASRFSGAFTKGISAMTVAAGNLISKGVEKLIGTAMSGLSAGIKRADILNQFPRVMSSLGYESDVAQKAIEQMMEHLQGLPTATQDMAQFVQQLTATTRNLETGTSLGLAFNDMLLAAGANTADATNAQQMFNKMLATGEYNAQRWASITSVMPGQLAQVAEHFLGAGATADDLGAALQSGAVSFDDLSAAMIEMDSVSTDAFTNFHDQAIAATGGISTALDNLGNRIGAGWANVIKMFDTAETDGSTRFGNIIYAFADGMKSSIVTFGELIKPAIDSIGLENIASGISTAFEGANAGVKAFFDSPVWQRAVLLFGTIKGAFEDFIGGFSGVGVGTVFLDPLMEGLYEIRRILEDIDFSHLGEMAGGAFEMIGGAVSTAFGYIDNFRIGLEGANREGNALDSLAGIFTTLSDTIKGALDAIDWQAVGSAAGGVLDYIAGAFETVSSFIEGFSAGWEYALESIATNDVSTIVQAIGDAFTHLGDVLVPVMDALGLIVGGALALAFETLGTVIAVVVEAIATLIDWVQHLPEYWDGMVTSVTQGVQNMKQGIVDRFNEVKNKVTSIWTNIKNTILNVWNGIKTNVTNAVNNVKTTVTNIFNNVKTTVTTVWTNIKNTILNVWNGIKSTVSNAVNAVKSTVSNVFNNVKTTVSNIWNGVKSTIASVWNGIKSNVTSAVNNVKTTVQNVFNNVKTTVQNIFNGVKNTVSTIWNNIKSTISNTITAAKNTVSNVVNGIRSNITNVFNGIKNTVSSIWNGVRNAITNPINTARNTVQNAINRIKGILSGRLSFPKISLPHFSISGKFSLNPPSIPTISVSWWKTGAILDGAQLIGAGEDGAEAIIPLTNRKYVRPFAGAIADELGNRGGVVITGNTFNVREDKDIERIAAELNTLINRQGVGAYGGY